MYIINQSNSQSEVIPTKIMKVAITDVIPCTGDK